MTRQWLIIDVSNIVWRAFYSSGGRDPSSSILLAINEFSRLGERFNTEEWVFAFDHKPYLRKDVLSTYKISRDSPKDGEDDIDMRTKAHMRDLVLELHDSLLDEIGLENHYSLPGYEADDIIAAVVAGLPKEDKAIVVSADQDLYQLLSPRVGMYHPNTNKFWNAKEFRDLCWVHPSQWAEAKAIAGDTGDDIPGLKGVGIQTACHYLVGDRIPPKKADAIKRFMDSPEFLRNLKLTTLPYPGIAPIAPIHGKRLDRGSFRVLGERMKRGPLMESLDVMRKLAI